MSPRNKAAKSGSSLPPCSVCPIHAAFVKAVLHRCVDLGWRDIHLAEKAGISKGHWSEIRNLKKSPTMESVIRILQAVGLEVNYSLRQPNAEVCDGHQSQTHEQPNSERGACSQH